MVPAVWLSSGCDAGAGVEAGAGAGAGAGFAFGGTYGISCWTMRDRAQIERTGSSSDAEAAMICLSG